MSKIDGTQEDPMTGDQTVYLSDGRAIRFSREMLRQGGLEAVMESMAAIQGEPVDVIQYGRKVGELPAFWHPGLARSTSFLFDYRRGDLRLEDGKWIASKTLGGGDLDCLVGFVRKEPSQ